MKSSKQKYHIGCSGFYNTDWKGSLYPEDSQNKDFLKLYSKTYNTVEINSTFYRKPTAKTLQKWNDETPDDFKFFIKIPKAISHFGYSESKKDECSDFCKLIDENMGHKLAGFLIQFPSSFHCTENNINWLNKTLPGEFLVAVEFRHQSWWNDEIFNLFKKYQWIFCGVSFPGKIPEDVIITNSKIGYYRLHGKPTLYKSPYSEEFLDNLAQEISNTNQEFYIYFNNTWGTSAIENSLYLKKILE
ncbi:MAG: histidine kinase [Chryseobacterium sp. 36-9]|nr:MAG: histidine kinase [Chryseobacterium sp. 36-9]